ncbi:MAG: DNA recombination protein RmuC [Microgenomates group bacterium]|nr:DNA recombination protein RmuC [Microgenomates group bacterium]
MSTTLLIVLILFFISLLIIRLWLNQLEEKGRVSNELIEWLKELGRRVENSTQAVDQKLTKNMEMFNSRLDKAAYVIAQVQKTIGEFAEIGRSMNELQQFLTSPKLRGNIGEQVLKELLSQYFPQDSYRLQYLFSNGEKVDAVIKTTQGLIPIDAKFPMENFRKLSQTTDEKTREKVKKNFIDDVKKHIQDIAKKYILVEQRTVDYALMYVPSEAVYYEIINEAELFDFAGQKRVLPVSPMSFYAYMKAILMSFEGQKIQTKAKEILAILRAIKKDYQKTEEAFSVMIKHLTNAYNQGSQVGKNLNNLGQKLSSTDLLPQETEKKLLQ